MKTKLNLKQTSSMSEENTRNTKETDNKVNVDEHADAKEQNMEEQIKSGHATTVEEEADLSQLVLDQQKQIAELEEKIQELKESNLRKTAELDNMKKRMDRDRVQIYESAKISALEHFLPVNDDLKRALKAIEESNQQDGSGIEDALQMIAKKFQDVLNFYNVEPIDQTGVPFDVDFHDALIRQKPQDDNIECDTVLEVLENGYRIGDRTIRHAKVIVSE